ncbi:MULTISPECIES: FeoA family protein [Novosphingobium]|uniref:Ferrous iron transport protein A n=2 Tax=Novosphingobium TaxID=165696 RepID=A0ABT0AI13_9SPHN|nr:MULTISPECIES: FeoA family protein [Novosphingobium]MCJ1962836.1 ferrous iron transport protein A [Novosphingobium mangrovi (ex Hu et al. 2023)]MED5547493.1 FeoA family protein [Pseudomonadota bacterium]QVM83205.1 ferrous iron transport protein A [Novosphingobium decolorationis]GAM05983.1 iron transporter [Novosphingobium sp. MBES04]
MTLDQQPIDQKVRIVAVDWDQLVPEEARRLRALGVDTGAQVSVSQRGVFGGRDPIALRIGRMVVAVRRAHAAAIEVSDLESTPA